MRVLHVIPSISPRRGGPSVAVIQMVQSLQDRGIEAEIVTTDDDGPRRIRVPLGTPVTRENCTVYFFRRQLGLYTVSYPLSRWLRKYLAMYDIVHIHALFNYPALVASSHAERLGVPYVIRPLGTLNQWGMTNRRPRVKALSFRFVERRMLANAAAIHFTSEAEQTEAPLHGSLARQEVIPLGVELSVPPRDEARRVVQTRFRIRLQPTVVTFMSRLDPKKGLDLLLPAAQQLDMNTSLLIAGAGSQEFTERMLMLAASLNLGDRIHWLGHVSGEDKLNVLGCSDVFVLPSYSENMGISVLEAMAAGLPVVVSDRVGLHNSITESSAGFATSPEIGPLADALTKLVQNQESRTAMGANAKRLVGASYSVSLMAQRLAALYDSVIEPRA